MVERTLFRGVDALSLLSTSGMPLPWLARLELHTPPLELWGMLTLPAGCEFDVIH